MVSAPVQVTGSGLTVRRRGKALLGPIDVALHAGEITVVLGPNGAGKTTLLRALYGLERINGGSIIRSDTTAQHQSFVFQTPIMLRRSVRGNLAYPLQMARLPRPEIATRVTDWADRTGLTPLLDQPAARLSGGEKQKLALARALITAPKVLLLDEPCASLDGRATRDIEGLIAAARTNGAAVMLTTHDLGQARRLADRVIFLKDGLLHEEGTAEQCLNAPRTAALAALLRGDIVD